MLRRGLFAALGAQWSSQLLHRRHVSDGLSAEEEALIAQLVQATARTPTPVVPTPVVPPPPLPTPPVPQTVARVDPVPPTTAVPLTLDCDVSQPAPHRAAPLAPPSRLPQRSVALFPKQWRCPGCTHLNQSPTSSLSPLSDVETAALAVSKFFCAGCGDPFPGVHDWACPSCHSPNPRAAQACCTCAAEKPLDWTCAVCSASHAISQQGECRQCHAPVPTTGATALPSSPPFTVRCAQCETLNDAQWDLCSCCLAPLPRLAAHRTKGHTSTPTPDVSDDVPSADPLAAAVVPTGSWQCLQCNVLQRRNASFCDICLRPRELASGKTYRPGDSSMPRFFRASNAIDTQREEPPTATFPDTPTTVAAVGDPLAGDWQCPYCRQFHKVTTLVCCAHEREVPQGYWLCRACCSTNRADRSACLGCGGQPEVMPWCCSVCTTANAEGHFSCAACGAAHPLLWRCDACKSVTSASLDACRHCAASKPALPLPVVCHVCKAPNVHTRRACFRCRARLAYDEWTCAPCQYAHNLGARCDRCQAARPYNLAEETWLCELCETAVVSGGDLPVLTQCPFCCTPRPPPEAGGVVSYPSRWVCARCGLFNRTSDGHCAECESRRELPPFHSTATCPECFRRTVLDERETCEHCQASLSAVLSKSLLSISLETSPLTELGRLAEDQLSAL